MGWKQPNILGFVGYWASGKSLMMVQEVLKRQREDPRLLVGHNFGFKGENGIELKTLDDAIAFAAWDTPGWRKLLAIDEIKMWCPPRVGGVFPPAADVVFTQGRKLKLSMMWTTQHWKFVDVTVRRVTDRVVECEGFIPKRISERGVLPVEHRPRLIRCRSFDGPDPEKNTLPERPNKCYWRRFRQDVADSYDTMALIKNAQMLMMDQREEMKNNPLLQVMVGVMNGE